jgi:hypothetical protein
MPPGGNRGSIAVVLVECVAVELEDLEAAVVAAALPSLVVSAEPDVEALSVLWPLDVEALDCVVDEGSADDCSAVVLGEEDDCVSEDGTRQDGKPFLWIEYVPLL